MTRLFAVVLSVGWFLCASAPDTLHTSRGVTKTERLKSFGDDDDESDDDFALRSDWLTPSIILCSL